MADSVSVFAEGTFEEQILELVTYIALQLPEDERPAFTQTFRDALHVPEGGKPIEEDEEKRKQVFSSVLAQVKNLGSGTEREIEGFFNLIFSHLFQLRPVDSAETSQDVSSLLKTIVASPSESISIKFRILSHLFNATPRTSPLRLSIYSTLLNLAVENGQLTQIQPSLKEVERWLSQWSISDEEKSAFLRSLVDAFAKSSQPDISYEFLLYYLRTLPPSSPAYNSAAVEAISTALRLPSVFDFDPLFKLDAVVAAKDHELFPLLQIFMNKGLAEYSEWSSSHSDTFSKYGLEQSVLEHKIMLLTLASLAFNNIGKDIPYSQVALAIQVDPSQVEKWVIHGIRSGLVAARLSQTKQTVHITRSTARGFEREQWETLEQRLVAWKTGLTDVLDIVTNARRQSAGHVSVQTQTVTA